MMLIPLIVASTGFLTWNLIGNVIDAGKSSQAKMHDEAGEWAAASRDDETGAVEFYLDPASGAVYVRGEAGWSEEPVGRIVNFRSASVPADPAPPTGVPSTPRRAWTDL